MKSGYKQTEAGVIPNDWDTKPMGSLTSLMTNGFVGTVTNDYVDSEDGVLYVQGYNVEENGFNFHGIKRVSKAFHVRNQKSCLRAGDLLTIQTGDIGVTTLVPPTLSGANCHALVISRFDHRVVDSRFYCQYFNSERGRAAFRQIETGSTMKHLNVGDMVKLLVPVPPISEQRCIASALFDVDALLFEQDQLIAKKRNVKQGAMQALMGKTLRLPGFRDEWRPMTMRELGVPYSGLSGKSKADFGVGSARYITFLNVLNNVTIDCDTLESVSVSGSERQNAVRKGDLFFNGSSETPDEVGMCSVLEDDLSDVYLNSFCFGFRPHSPLNASGPYLAYFFRGHVGRSHLSSLAQGAIRYNLSKAQFLDLQIALPAFEEQVAITSVLRGMDTEITALEARRDKTRLLKQGMMQELLTGRIRLV